MDNLRRLNSDKQMNPIEVQGVYMVPTTGEHQNKSRIKKEERAGKRRKKEASDREWIQRGWIDEKREREEDK